jgi:uncharacterized protein
MRLEQRVVVITGASSGIGRAAAVEFARRGSNLILSARREELLHQVSDECRSFGVTAHVVPADVGRRADCERLISQALAHFGRIDVLVNNAGFAIFDRLVDARLEDLEQMMQTNYFGMVYCTHAALPSMIARGEGAIVNIASTSGLMGFYGMGGYSATKFAMSGFSDALRDELASKGISVSVIYPNTTRTDFFVTAYEGKMPGFARLVLAMSPGKVARAIVRAAESGRAAVILPWYLRPVLKLKAIAPRLAHALFRGVSRLVEERSNS